MRSTTADAGVIERAIRAGIVGVWVEGLRRRDPGAVANALLAFAGTYVPAVLERRFGVSFRPWQRAYAAGGMLAHAVGMLGPYDDVWWWDHLTHVHSATVLGGLVHAHARRRGRDPRSQVLGAVLGAGLVWELVEYAGHAAADRLGFEPVLVSYGAVDTAVDLVFDLVGAVLVIAFGDRILGNLVGTE